MVTLTLENLQMVHRIRWHHFPLVPPAVGEELVGAGMLGLAQAAKSYREDLGKLFSSWAYGKVRGAMLDHVRKETGCRNADSWHGRSVDWRPALTLTDQALERRAAPQDPIGEWELSDTLDQAIEQTLEPRERYVIRARYLHDLSILRIAQTLGVSDGRVCQISKEACRKLRLALDQDALAHH